MPMHKGTFNEIGRNMSVSTNSLHEIQTLPNALPLSNPNKENHCSTKLMYYNDEQYTRVIQPLINFIKNTGTCDNSILPSLHDALDAAYTFSRKIHSFTLMKQIAKQHLAVIGKLLISETINVLASVSKFALFLFNETNLIKVEHVEDILLQDFTRNNSYYLSTLKIIILQFLLRSKQIVKHQETILTLFSYDKRYLLKCPSLRKNALIKILLNIFTMLPDAKVLIGMKFLEYIKAFDQHFEIYIKNMDSQIFRKQLTIYATKCSEKSLIDRYINSFYLAYLSQYDDKTLLREILKLKDAPQVDSEIKLITLFGKEEHNILKELSLQTSLLLCYNLSSGIISSKTFLMEDKIKYLRSLWKVLLLGNFQYCKKQQFIFDKTLMFLNSNMKSISNSREYLADIFQFLKEICLLHSDYKRLDNVINMSYNTFIITKDNKFINASINFEIIKYLSFHNYSNTSQVLQRLTQFALCITDSQSQLVAIRLIYSFYLLCDIESPTTLTTLCQTICLQLQKILPAAACNKLLYSSEIQLAILFSSQNVSASSFLSTCSPINMLFFSCLTGNPRICHEDILKSRNFKYHFLHKYERLLKLTYYLNMEMSMHQTINLPDITNTYLNKWMKISSQVDKTVSSIEIGFVNSLIQYLNMSGFHKQILELYSVMESQKKYYKPILNISELWMLRSLIALQLSYKLQDFGDKHNYVDKHLLKEASFENKLLYLDKCIELFIWQNNFAAFEKLFFDIIPQECNEVFDIHNESKLSISRYIQVLLFNIRLHISSSKLHANKSNFIGTVIEAKKSLKLAISLTKKVDKLAQSSRIYVLQSVVSSFGNLIKQFTSLGLAKEAEFYTKELIRMLPALSEPPLIFQCFCHLHNFYLLSEQERHLESILQKINKIFDHIQGAYDINSLCHYLFANKEYAKIFVSLDIFFGNDANQKSTLGQYWRLQMGETVDETTCFPIYKNINHINHIQNQYNNLMKDIETDPFFGTIFESALASPSLRIKSDIISTSDTSKHESMSTEVITPNKLPRPSNMTPRSKNTRQDFDRFVVTSKLKDIIGELQTTDLNTLSHLELTKHASLYSLVFTTYYSVKINDPSEQLHLKFWFYISDMIHNRPLFYDKHLSSLDNSIYDEMKLYSFNNSSINEQDISWKEPYHFEKESFDFNIVSIDICSLTDNLILSKYNGLFNDWTTLRIPLKGGHSRDVDLEYFSFSDGFKEINDIIKCNDMTTSNKVTNSILTAEGRKNWWNKRYELDKRLENLLSKMSNNWLGGFKGFFDPCVIDVHAFEDFSKQFYHILHEFLPSRKHFKDPSKFIQIEEWILELFLKLDCEDKKYIYQVEDLLFFVLDILLYHGEENAYCEIDISHMHVELTEAIRKYQRNTQQNSILNKETYNQKKHTFLLVSTACHLFPWESLPFLKEFSITRIPSLRSLDLLLMNNDMKFTLELPLTKDIRMILNPNGDLNKTEIRFKELFNKIQESTLNSRLLINEKPSELDFLSFIKSSKLFIYVGHGSGEQYVRLSQIKSCNKVAVSFLLGCSSAAMKYYGKLEPSGSIYSYLLAGCPLVLGNLWDVTDKDIDKFSMSLFEKTGISKNLQGEIAGYQTVPIAVAKSRESCNLKFMNGAAPVIYGLPVHFI
ncbi:separin [Monosporozyma unispora]